MTVENRPGALCVIAAREVARTDPDGHTLIMNGSLLLMNDILAPDPNFAGMRAFAPVSSVSAEPVIRRLHGEFARILKSPEIVEQWIASGAKPGGNTPEEFGAYISEEYDRWGRIIRERGIRVN